MREHRFGTLPTGASSLQRVQVDDRSITGFSRTQEQVHAHEITNDPNLMEEDDGQEASGRLLTVLLMVAALVLSADAALITYWLTSPRWRDDIRTLPWVGGEKEVAAPPASTASRASPMSLATPASTASATSAVPRGAQAASPPPLVRELQRERSLVLRGEVLGDPGAPTPAH